MRKSIYVGLFATIVMFAGVTSCSNVTESQETEEISFAPIPEDWNTKKKGGDPLSAFGCTVSTLNSKDAESRFSYKGFELAIPERILQEANGKVTIASFRLTHPDVNKGEVSEIELDDYVRIVDCKIPDHPEMISAIESKLTNFDESSWAIDNSLDNQNRTKSPDGYYIQVCDYQVTGVAQIWKGGVLIGYAFYRSLVCSQEFVEYPEPFGPGGGMGSGDDPNPPCEPWEICDENVGGAVPVPADPCLRENPPKYCEQCTDGDLGIMNEVDIKAGNEELLKSSNSTATDQSDREEVTGFYVEIQNNAGNTTGYSLVSVPDGVYSYNPQNCRIDVDEDKFEALIKSLRGQNVYWVHTHPWSIGEEQECRNRPTYDGQVGATDKPVFNWINRVLTYKDRGQPLKGAFIIDKDGTRTFDGDKLGEEERLLRCGF